MATNRNHQYAVIDDENREISVHVTFRDAVEAATLQVKETGHTGYAIVNLRSRVIENWCSRG